MNEYRLVQAGPTFIIQKLTDSESTWKDTSLTYSDLEKAKERLFQLRAIEDEILNMPVVLEY